MNGSEPFKEKEREGAAWTAQYEHFARRKSRRCGRHPSTPMSDS
jgi:hypothetical protein